MASVLREVSSAQCNGVHFVGVLSLGKIVEPRTDFGVCGEGGEEAVEVILVHVAGRVGAGIGTFPAVVRIICADTVVLGSGGRNKVEKNWKDEDKQ